MTTISITAQSSDRRSLEEARAVIDRLLAQSAEAAEMSAPAEEAAPPNGHQQPSEGELAQSFVDDLWGRTGDGLHQLISAMASFDDRFSLADVAEETGETLSKTH